MPQEFYVLRCFSCDTFQVHIVKKAKKWECKMCGAKQSVKRNYGKGSSKDCRAQVMKLNELRMLKSEPPDDFESDENSAQDEIPETKPIVEKKPGVSKWTEYLDEEPKEETDPEDESDMFGALFDGRQKESKKRVWNEVDKSGDEMKRKKTRQEENGMNEEQNNSCEALNPVQNIKFNKEEINESRSFIESKSRGKQSKYSKYLDEDETESNDDLLGNVKKSSNIFGSDPTDLDSVLNF